MLILQRLGSVAAFATLAGLLTASCASAAVPTFEVQKNWQATNRKPPPPGIANCTGQPVGGERARNDAAWTGGDAAPLSSQAQRALHGGGKADLDGYTGRCRLDDAKRDEEQALNEGLDPEALLKLLAELAEMDRNLTPQEQQALLDELGNNVHVELDSIDHELHAYIGMGDQRQDLGPLSRLDLQQAEEDGLVVLRFGQEDGRYAPGDKRHGADIDSNARLGPSTAAIPEPSTYAMLLSGLILLGLLRRRRNGA
jgi:hypothetical protein